MSHYSIPTPDANGSTALEIRSRLLDGERIEYEEIEELDDRDFRDVIRPIAVDDGDGWIYED